MRPRSVQLACAIVVAATLSPQRPAGAAPTAGADADAQDLFVRGREFRARHDCAGAAPLFRKANELAPHRLGSLRNLAECEEALGHFASARRAWLELWRGLLVTKEPAKYEGWAVDAREGATRLLPKVAKLTIELKVARPEGEGPAQPSDATTLTVNGDPIPLSLYGTVLERDPGRYTVRAEAARGERAVEQVVSLGSGGATQIQLRLRLKGAANLEAAPPARAGTLDADPNATRRTLGWVSLGVGGAALVVAGVSLAVRQSALSDLAAACPRYATGPCPSSTSPLLARGSTASTMVTAFGVAGGVLAASGLALVLASAPSARVPGPAGRPAERASLVVSPSAGGAQVTWRFE